MVKNMARLKGLTMRPLKESEIALLPKLWDDSGLPYKSAGRDSLKKLRAQRKADMDLFIGVFQGKKMVAAAIASDDGRKGWINRLAVLPDMRGKGIAVALISECEKILRRKGIRLFCVHIEGYNSESMRLFEKAGYKKEEDIFYYTKRELDSY